MDLSNLLPLFLQKNGGEGNEKMNTLLRFAQGEKPDMGAVMNMAMQNKKKNAAVGLRPIVSVASYSILGKLCKWVLL
ncbi:MAG: hypothetical protein HFE46_05570 [Clostridia bacterium]|jgi:hypothetical protein|nr:hypothetical protein [Clostridia bacterium]